MPNVTMPDGAVVAMPDNLDPALGARLRSFQQSGGQPPESAGRLAEGAAQVAGSAVANIPHAIGGALNDIYNRITGNYGPGADTSEPGWLNAIHVEPGAAGQQFGPAVAGAIERGIDKTGAGDALASAAGATQRGAESFEQNHPFVSHVVAPIAADVVGLEGARAIPGAVGRTVGAARGAVDAARGGAFETGESGAPSAADVGLEAPKNNPLNSHQHIGNVIAGNEAGLQNGVAMSPETLSAARAAPDSVYERAGNSMTPGPLRPEAAAEVQAAGQPEGGRVSQGSPQAQNQIETLRQQLLAPTNRAGEQWTGQNWVNELRGLRQEGYANIGSDDVSNQQLGRAQLQMARAVETHVGNSLPPGADVDLPQFQAARQALAKNWTVQGALKGGNIDMGALARIYRADPKLLTGGIAELAKFADANPELVRLSNRYQPDLGVKDISLTRPASLIKPLQNLAGRAFNARRSSQGAAAANEAFPPRSPDAFAPIQPRELQLAPSPSAPPTSPQYPLGGTRSAMNQGSGEVASADANRFTTSVGVNPGGTPSSGRIGDIAYSDMLAHGVEQAAPQGLSVGPMGIPEQGGLPFQRNAGHEAGGLTLAPTGAPPGVAPKLGDLAAVQSQGVPEGTVARTAQAPEVTHEADEDTGAHVVRSPNGETHAQESGPYLIAKRSDTTAGAQGNGEGTARMEALVQQAESRGLTLGSDVSVSPAQAKVYQRLERMGYKVTKNPFTKNPDTGNLVSRDPRKPIFEVSTPLSMALAGR